MAVGYGAKIVTDGLVLCLDAANPKSYPGSGTTWFDLSGNDNDGTLVNGVGYSSDNQGSMVFDGVNNYINVTSATSSEGQSFIADLKPDVGYFYTKSVWFFPKSRTSNDGILNRHGGYDSSGGTNWVLYLSSSTSIRYRTYGTDRGASITIPNLINNWHNITIAFDGQQTSLFLNGKLEASNNSTGDIRQGGRFNIGYWQYQSAHFNGNISNVQIYNRALSAEEIQQNFQATRGRYGI